MSDLSERLLEAHVQHELERWRGQRGQTLGAWVSALYRWFEEVSVSDVVSHEEIMGIIDRYVIDLRVSGGITELAGEMARVVFNSPSSADTRLDQVLADVAYEGFAQKVGSLDALRRELLTIIMRSESFAELTARVVARTLAVLILERRVEGPVARKLLAALERRVAGALLKRREKLPHIEDQLLEVLDPESVRSVADEVWLSISSLRLSDAFQLISENDLEDFVALGYEFWLRYRKSDYFRRVSAEVLQHFLDKYGDSSLAALSLDMGVTATMVAEELDGVLAPWFLQADASGFLEQQIRARLTPFYRSEALLEVLSGS